MKSGQPDQIIPFRPRTTNNRVINDLNNELRCACCCRLTGKTQRSIKGKNRTSRRIKIHSNPIHLHISAVALARRDFFPDESSNLNRFTRKEFLTACESCFCKYRRKFKDIPFNSRTSEFFHYLMTEPVHDLEPENDIPMNMDYLEQPEAQPAEQENLNDSPGHPQYRSSPVDPSPSFYFADEQFWDDEQFYLGHRMFNMGFEDDEELDNEFPSSDSDDTEDETEDPKGHLIWNSDSLEKQVRVVELNQDTNKCICCNTESFEKHYLDLETLWSFAEYSGVCFIKSTEQHYVCDACIALDGKIKKESKENLDEKDECTKRKVKRLRQFPGSTGRVRYGAVLRSNVSQIDINTTLENCFADKRMRENRLLKISGLTPDGCADLLGLHANQIRYLLQSARQNGLLDGREITAEQKMILYFFKLRQNTSIRSLAALFKISKTTVEKVFKDCQNALQKFAADNTKLPHAVFIRDELTTAYSKLVYRNDFDENVEPLIFVLDGGYIFSHAPRNDVLKSHSNWSDHKKSHLIKTLTITTTSGHVVWSDRYWPGKTSDNDSLKQIMKGEIPEAEEFLDLVKSNACVFVLDAGFMGFKKWFDQNPQEFPNLRVFLPNRAGDPNDRDRVSSERADFTRQKVTSVRHIVENIHSHQKTWKIQGEKQNMDFLENNFMSYHKILNGCLNYFGINHRSGLTVSRFRDEERYDLIKNNPHIIESDLSSYLCLPGHDLEFKKRGMTVWREAYHDSDMLIHKFPELTDLDIDALTGGIYQRKKSKAYISMALDHFRKRKESRNQSLDRASTTQSNFRFSFAIQELTVDKMHYHFNDEFTSVIRGDIPSFHSSYRKFKVMIGINLNTKKFAFACTCSCGNRTTPCVHSVVFITIFSQRLTVIEDNNVEYNSSEDEV